jgi:threonine dehydratase
LRSSFHYLSPQTQIFGVEPEGFNGLGSSLAHGVHRNNAARPEVDLRRLDVTPAGRCSFAAVMTANVRGITVDDAAVRRAMKSPSSD